MRRGIVGLGALLVVLAPVGCGSDKEKEYRKEANSICADAKERLDKLPSGSSVKQVAKVAKQEVAIRKELVMKLGELTPPMKIANLANDVFEDQEAREERAHAMEKAAEKNDEKKIRKIREEGKRQSELEAGRADAAGLRDCAEV